MSNPIIPTFAGILAEGQRLEHVQTGHLGTVVEHVAGTYVIRWDADVPVRTFEARFIRPVNA